MSHYAQINENNIVIQVIVASEDFIQSGSVGDPSKWIQTSYNTSGSKHALEGIPLRKNYAGIGYTYDFERDAFIPPKPYPSFILNETTCLWESPVPFPNDGKFYRWDEDTLNWIDNSF